MSHEELKDILGPNFSDEEWEEYLMDCIPE